MCFSACESKIISRTKRKLCSSRIHEMLIIEINLQELWFNKLGKWICHSH